MSLPGTNSVVWGVDSKTTQLSIAWAADRVRSWNLPRPVARELSPASQHGPARRHRLYLAACQLTDEVVALSGVPTVVAIEAPAGRPNPALYAAWGVVQEAIYGRLTWLCAHQPNVWSWKPDEWRKRLNLPYHRDVQSRKAANRHFALSLGAAPDLTEDEYDAIGLWAAQTKELNDG